MRCENCRHLEDLFGVVDILLERRTLNCVIVSHINIPRLPIAPGGLVIQSMVIWPYVTHKIKGIISPDCEWLYYYGILGSGELSLFSAGQWVALFVAGVAETP